MLFRSALDEQSPGASRFYPEFRHTPDDDPFFYAAKVFPRERNEGMRGRENLHPTVKPLALMRWLVRMVTPKGGTVLDPFTGSGTTGCAAMYEGVRFLGVEREPEYVGIARERIAHHAVKVHGGVIPPWNAPSITPAPVPTSLEDLFGF